MEVPTAKLVGQKKPDKAPINRIPGISSKKQMNRNLNKNKDDFQVQGLSFFFSKKGGLPNMDCWCTIACQPLGFEDAAVMWWADFDFENFAENSSPLGDLTLYLYYCMCKDDENTLDFSFCFNWGGLRLVYDMHSRHFNVLLKILLHVQWFFPRSIVSAKQTQQWTWTM